MKATQILNLTWKLACVALAIVAALCGQDATGLLYMASGFNDEE